MYYIVHSFCFFLEAIAPLTISKRLSICHRKVSKQCGLVFHKCFTSVSQVFHECLSGISPMFHQNCKRLSPVFFNKMFHTLQKNFDHLAPSRSCCTSRNFYGEICIDLKTQHSYQIPARKKEYSGCMWQKLDQCIDTITVSQ